jgi:hypothetical protein
MTFEQFKTIFFNNWIWTLINFVLFYFLYFRIFKLFTVYIYHFLFV